MNRPPRIGEIVCDCRYKHLAVTKVSNLYPEDDDVELEDGFHCSWVHCLDEVPHPEWSHEEPPSSGYGKPCLDEIDLLHKIEKKEAAEVIEGEADLLRRLHEEYPWTAFVPDVEWLKKIEEARAHPERGLPRPERRTEKNE